MQVDERSSATVTSELALGPVVWAVLTTGILLAGYLAWTPLSPDLAAQVARADVARQVGPVTWYSGWFGGLSMPTYSVFVPTVMAVLGAPVTGALGVLLGAWSAGRLSLGCVRPRAAAVSAAVVQVADLVDGRVTFAVGLGLVLAALATMRTPIVASALVIAGCLASPLAGLFGGIVLLAVALTVPDRRRLALGLCAELIGTAAALAWLFPGTGTMPVSVPALIVPAVCGVLVLATCRHRTVRLGAALVVLSLPLLYVDPGAIGNNIARIAWVFTVPVVVGCARLPRGALVLAVLVAAQWPTQDLGQQLIAGRDAATKPAYYSALLAHLATALGSTPGARLELVLPASKWAVVYLANHVALARGWDRQADVADNPLFYDPEALTAASYHDWLQQLAVGWVALPRVSLDSAARAEGTLVSSGLPYLAPVWFDRSWTLYRVLDAAPLVVGASVTAEAPTSITVHVSTPGIVTTALRWTPYMTVETLRGRAVASVASRGGWAAFTVRSPGDYRLTTRFRPLARLIESGF